MKDRVTLRDRCHNLLQRGGALRAAVSLYAALGRRGRNGIWVFWTSLDDTERQRYVRHLRAAMNECWHLARDPGAVPGYVDLWRTAKAINPGLSHVGEAATREMVDDPETLLSPEFDRAARGAARRAGMTEAEIDDMFGPQDKP